MPKICVLDKTTNACVGVYEIASIADWKDHGNMVLSPRHDGQSGWTLINGEWVDPTAITLGIVEKWARVRATRDKLLAASDVYMLADYPLSDAQLVQITAYRKALRELPQVYSDPDAVVFPQLII